MTNGDRPPRSIPQPGARVFTLDQQELGVVQQVWPDLQTVPDNVTANTALISPDASEQPLSRPGLMLVRAGDADFYIPLGAIARTEGDRITLGVPTKDVQDQGWSERPRQLAGQ
jgi:hypothetical protein